MQTSVEITASTVEEAIEKGLQQLGVGPSQVIVEVIEEPSRGIFGLGAKQARVRLQLLAPPPPPKQAVVKPEPPKKEAPAVVKPATSQSLPEETVTAYYGDEDDFFDEDGSYGVEEDNPYKQVAETPLDSAAPLAITVPTADAQPSRPKHKPRRNNDSADVNQEKSEIRVIDTPPIQFAEGAGSEEIARQVLSEILDIMEMDAEIDLDRSAPSEKDNLDGPPWILNIHGDNERITDLIGRRGDTLSAMQYLTRLIVSKQTEARANIIVDVDGYRRNRSEKLEKLAHRMADQAVETKRMVRMEPMPPHERRIIHMVLRNRDDVDTESKGQGSERRVTIVPKETN